MKSVEERAKDRIARRLSRSGPPKKTRDEVLRGRGERRAVAIEWATLAALVERAKSARFHRYVKCDDDGNVLTSYRSDFPGRPGYDEVTEQEDQDRMMEGARRFRKTVDPETGKTGYGHKPRIRLSVDNPEFFADGVDTWKGMVFRVPDGMGPVKVRVNRKVQLWEPDVLYGETSTTPGERWTVMLDDARFWAEDESFSVMSVEPPTEEPEVRP